MNSALPWTGHLELYTHVFRCDLDAFDYDVETYTHWVWLALEKGRFTFRLGRGKNAVAGEAAAGDWVLCPPGEPLRRRMLARCSFHYIAFAPCGTELFGLRGPGTLRDTARLNANLAALRAAHADPEADFWKAHLLLDTLRRAARESEAGHGSAVKMDDALMHHIRASLETNSAGKISFAALGAASGLTPSALSKRFRAAFGQSPQEFLLGHRLAQARRLLLETDLTLDAIAHCCGLSTGFYLTRQWTAHVGIAPSHFRRMHRI